MRSARRGTCVWLVLAALTSARVARSQPTAPSEPSDATAPKIEGEPAPLDEGGPSPKLVDLEKAPPPPPTNVFYFQYGVALAAEIVSAPGPICDNAAVPCILGPGGGITVRAGVRGAGPFYLGGAYEVTKQDPNKLYRLALLQQARVEGRYYFMTARVTEPYAALGLGISGYGNEWSVDTWGPGGSLGFGVEYQMSRRTVVGVGASYRLLYFSRFTDTSGAARDPGIGQLFGIDLVLEQREPFFTGTSRDNGPK